VRRAHRNNLGIYTWLGAHGAPYERQGYLPICPPLSAPEPWLLHAWLTRVRTRLQFI